LTKRVELEYSKGVNYILFMSKTVFVGMSGGVDSSVSAYLLQQQGYKVIGVFMKNWSGKLKTSRGFFDFPCSSQADYEDARQVAGHLDIPLYTFDFEEEYRNRVIEYFITEIKRGRTPNPDIMCNKEIKFKVFLDKCFSLGADYIATGHYARVSKTVDGIFHLLKGIDNTKDQSYFLATLGQYELSHTLFPVGDIPKTQVREIAEQIQLPNAKKPDSQGICFVGEIDVNAFIEAFVGENRGDIISTEGEVLGQHRGLYFYTIGQRKGLGIGGGIPYFVKAKDLEHNQLIVAKGLDPLDLYQSEVRISELSWTSQCPNLQQQFRAKIRYRSQDVECLVKPTADNNMLAVEFTEPQRAITQGQFLVLYQGDELIGSGVMG
jgi:tRNA-specific 2-thiouridylase